MPLIILAETWKKYVPWPSHQNPTIPCLSLWCKQLTIILKPNKHTRVYWRSFFFFNFFLFFSFFFFLLLKILVIPGPNVRLELTPLISWVACSTELASPSLSFLKYNKKLLICAFFFSHTFPHTLQEDLGKCFLFFLLSLPNFVWAWK